MKKWITCLLAMQLGLLGSAWGEKKHPTPLYDSLNFLDQNTVKLCVAKTIHTHAKEPDFDKLHHPKDICKGIPEHLIEISLKEGLEIDFNNRKELDALRYFLLYFIDNNQTSTEFFDALPNDRKERLLGCVLNINTHFKTTEGIFPRPDTEDFGTLCYNEKLAIEEHFILKKEMRGILNKARIN